MGAKVGRKVQGYAEGWEYGLRVSAGMLDERRRENDRYIAASPYVARGSVTRAFWLGFRRAVRAGRWNS